MKVSEATVTLCIRPPRWNEVDHPPFTRESLRAISKPSSEQAKEAGNKVDLGWPSSLHTSGMFFLIWAGW